MRILVVGVGSIGTRHLNNLNELGVETTGIDPRGSESTMVLYDSVDKAIKYFHPDAAVIATPTHLHIDAALKVAKHNMPLFIEKPVSHNLKQISILQYQLSRFQQWAVVGYSLRFHPAIQKVRELLPQIGTPLYARAEVGQYLPDWHPTEDYRNWYMAKEEQGGGALLDLSHEIDYVSWLLGPIREPRGWVDNIRNSGLEITSDSLADFIAGAGTALVSIHMDLLDRSYNRRLRIVGTEGSIMWDCSRPYIELLKQEGSYNHGWSQDRNVQFKEEMRAFIESVQEGKPHPDMATLEDGIAVLKTVLDLKEQNGR